MSFTVFRCTLRVSQIVKNHISLAKILQACNVVLIYGQYTKSGFPLVFLETGTNAKIANLLNNSAVHPIKRLLAAQ